MSKVMQAQTSALSLAEFKTETGQVLTAETVKNYLVSGNGAVTDQETLMFIELCKAQKLNPFIREAYLIKFGNSPANIVVGKDVFVKRAYRNPNFEGMKAGIVILKPDGSMDYREGSLKAPKEQLVGGWCEVYVKDMKDFADMNAVYDAWVAKGHEPARACVEAKMARENLLVEMSVVAAVK